MAMHAATPMPVPPHDAPLWRTVLGIFACGAHARSSSEPHGALNGAAASGRALASHDPGTTGGSSTSATTPHDAHPAAAPLLAATPGTTPPRTPRTLAAMCDATVQAGTPSCRTSCDVGVQVDLGPAPAPPAFQPQQPQLQLPQVQAQPLPSFPLSATATSTGTGTVINVASTPHAARNGWGPTSGGGAGGPLSTGSAHRTQSGPPLRQQHSGLGALPGVGEGERDTSARSVRSAVLGLLEAGASATSSLLGMPVLGLGQGQGAGSAWVRKDSVSGRMSGVSVNLRSVAAASASLPAPTALAALHREAGRRLLSLRRKRAAAAGGGSSAVAALRAYADAGTGTGSSGDTKAVIVGGGIGNTGYAPPPDRSSGGAEGGESVRGSTAANEVGTDSVARRRKGAAARKAESHEAGYAPSSEDEGGWHVDAATQRQLMARRMRPWTTARMRNVLHKHAPAASLMLRMPGASLNASGSADRRWNPAALDPQPGNSLPPGIPVAPPAHRITTGALPAGVTAGAADSDAAGGIGPCASGALLDTRDIADMLLDTAPAYVSTTPPGSLMLGLAARRAGAQGGPGVMMAIAPDTPTSWPVDFGEQAGGEGTGGGPSSSTLGGLGPLAGLVSVPSAPRSPASGLAGHGGLWPLGGAGGGSSRGALGVEDLEMLAAAVSRAPWRPAVHASAGGPGGRLPRIASMPVLDEGAGVEGAGSGGEERLAWGGSRGVVGVGARGEEEEEGGEGEGEGGTLLASLEDGHRSWPWGSRPSLSAGASRMGAMSQGVALSGSAGGGSVMGGASGPSTNMTGSGSGDGSRMNARTLLARAFASVAAYEGALSGEGHGAVVVGGGEAFMAGSSGSLQAARSSSAEGAGAGGEGVGLLAEGPPLLGPTSSKRLHGKPGHQKLLVRAGVPEPVVSALAWAERAVAKASLRPGSSGIGAAGGAGRAGASAGSGVRYMDVGSSPLLGMGASPVTASPLAQRSMDLGAAPPPGGARGRSLDLP